MTRRPHPCHRAAATLMLSIGAWPAAGAAAEPAALHTTTLPAVRVTAPPSALPKGTGQDLSRITRDELQASPGDSLARILGRVPGVQFTTSGGPQTVTNLYLRGANPAQTLILLNGIRIGDATTGGALLPAIDPAHLDHVDIARGAAASRYGADAIGGAINLVTTAQGMQKPLVAWADAGVGSHDTAQSSLGLAGAAQGWDYRLVASAARSRGFDATHARLSNGQPNPLHDPDRDGYTRHALSGTLGREWRAGHRVALTAYDGFTHGRYDAGPSPVDAYTLYRQQVVGLESSDRLTDRWQSTFSFGFTRDSSTDRSDFPNAYASLARHYRWLNTFETAKDHRLSVFIEHREERVRGTTHYAYDARNLNAAGLAYQLKYRRLHAEASLREDRFSRLARHGTGSLALAYDLNEVLQVGIAANTALRVPSFNDLYYPGFFGLYAGNPELKPETSKNLEAHLAYASGPTELRLTVFRNRVKNLISTSTLPPYSPANIGRATLQGLSISGSTAWADASFQAGVDLLDPRNDRPKAGESSWLPQRARQVLRLAVQRPWHPFTLAAQFQYTGNRPDGYTQARLGGYALLDLSARYAINSSLSITLRLNNVLDRRTTTLDGYRNPGTTAFVNLAWHGS